MAVYDLLDGFPGLIIVGLCNETVKLNLQYKSMEYDFNISNGDAGGIKVQYPWLHPWYMSRDN